MKLAIYFTVLIAACLLGVIDPVQASMFGFIGAVVAVKSTPLTNADATPVVINRANVARARVLHARGVATSANGDSINSTYRFARIKSNDLVTRVMIDNASWGAACTMSLGLYDTAANGGAVVDVKFFAQDFDMNTAHAATDVTRATGGTITVANMEKRIWELLALSADPQKEYDIVGTLTAAAAAAGAACVQVHVAGAA